MPDAVYSKHEHQSGMADQTPDAVPSKMWRDQKLEPISQPRLPAIQLLPWHLAWSEKGVRVAQNMQVGPCTPVGIQL